MDDSFKVEAKRVVDDLRKKLNEDIFVFHSTLDVQNPHFQIDSIDPNIFEFLIYADKNRKSAVNLMIHTRGGDYPSAIEIHKLLRDNYKTIKSVVPAVAMSCGTALCMMSDELFLHQNCSMGAFDPQWKVSPNYPPVGLYSFLKQLGINNPTASVAKIVANAPPPVARLFTDAHADYYAIDGYLRNAFGQSKLINPADIQSVLDRFYKDDHIDYVSHGKKIDFADFRTHVPAAKPLALHSEPHLFIELFSLCEELINKYCLARLYILNDTFYFR